MSPATLDVSTRPRSAPDDSARPVGGWRTGRSARLVAVALVAAVVAVDPGGLRPFTTVRWPLVAGLLLAAVAVGWRERAPVPPVLRALGLAFLAWMTLATVVALDPVNAWLGHPQRHLGWLGWVVCAGGFVAGLAVTTDDARRRLGRGAIVAGAMLGVGAALDLAGVDIGGVAGGFGSRAGGFLGQPAFLGAAGVLVVPVALAASRGEMPPWRWAGRAAAVAGAAAVVASQTRGAWIGLAVAAFVAWPRLRPRTRASGVVAAIGVVVLVVVAVLTPIGSRAVGALDLEDGSGRGRVDEWRVAAAVIVAHPVLGAGPEGYRVVVPAAIDDDYTQRHGRDVVADRAHDGVLDVAATGGVPAAILYVALVAFVLWRALRARRDTRPVVVGAAAAVVGYAAQQLVLFPVAELDPFAWAFAGVVLAATAKGRAHSADHADGAATPTSTAAISGAVVGVAAGVLVVLVAVMGAFAVAADHQLAAAVRERSTGDQRTALAAADRATELRPDDVDTWFVAADVAASGDSLLDIDAALDRIESGLAWSPLDPALLDHHEQLLTEWALRSGLDDDLDRAERTSIERIAADPANPAHHRRLGLVLLARGDAVGAARSFERVLVLAGHDGVALTALERIPAGGR